MHRSSPRNGERFPIFTSKRGASPHGAGSVARELELKIEGRKIIDVSREIAGEFNKKERTKKFQESSPDRDLLCIVQQCNRHALSLFPRNPQTQTNPAASRINDLSALRHSSPAPTALPVNTDFPVREHLHSHFHCHCGV